MLHSTMRYYYTDSEEIKEWVGDLLASGGRVTFRSTEDVELNDYIPVYLFEVVDIPLRQYEVTEQEFQTFNPEWCRLHWEFAKQMAEARRDVYLFSRKWFWYYAKENVFTAMTKDVSLEKIAILMTGSSLSFRTEVQPEKLFRCLVFGNNLSRMINICNFKENDCDSFETLSNKLVAHLDGEELEANFWFQAFTQLLDHFAEDDAAVKEDNKLWKRMIDNETYSRYEPEFKNFRGKSFKVTNSLLSSEL